MSSTSEETAVAHGRVVALAELHEEMEQARSGLAVQLDTLTHNASEFLRREQDLLLDGRGLPDLQTRLSQAARPGGGRLRPRPAGGRCGAT